MGYIRHHAIVVTGHTYDATDFVNIYAAHEVAKEAGCIVSEVVDAGLNATASFLVAPDGSKEGWAESNGGDAARDRFVEWLVQRPSWFAWAEVALGPDDGEAVVERSAWGVKAT